MFKKVLVANRGEIALRIIRALREMDIASVAVFSEVDRTSLHVQMADEAVAIGPSPSAQSYLDGERVIQAAHLTGAEAIHPGYGFLSENAAFARLCRDNEVKFIGPSPESIEQVGSKISARRLALAVGAPVVPGTEQGVRDLSEASKIALQIGYPVLLKAAAGGGGKGMRAVENEGQLESAMRAASSEAEAAFGSGEVYLEKLITRPRHIEIQVLGDEAGHLIHLGERECSIQRRHQKVVEECPSPMILARPELRKQISEAALKIARAANYFNAGTLEFLADSDGRFYFLEMNTRLQVEHPVTEWVTGIDLVQWQIRIACGTRLTIQQEDVRWRGSAIECRVYAEDPENNYFPSPGRISHYAEPSGPGVRVDAGVYAGWNVPLEYDPLLAKLTVWAETRESAVSRLRRALAEYQILGVTTNLELFEKLTRDPRFLSGDLHTSFLNDFAASNSVAGSLSDTVTAALLAAAVHAQNSSTPREMPPDKPGLWRAEGRWSQLR